MDARTGRERIVHLRRVAQHGAAVELLPHGFGHGRRREEVGGRRQVGRCFREEEVRPAVVQRLGGLVAEEMTAENFVRPVRVVRIERAGKPKTRGPPTAELSISSQENVTVVFVPVGVRSPAIVDGGCTGPLPGTPAPASRRSAPGAPSVERCHADTAAALVRGPEVEDTLQESSGETADPLSPAPHSDRARDASRVTAPECVASTSMRPRLRCGERVHGRRSPVADHAHCSPVRASSSIQSSPRPRQQDGSSMSESVSASRT